MLKVTIPTVFGECGHKIILAPYEIARLARGETNKVMCMTCETMREIKPQPKGAQTMDAQHQKTLEQHADALRFILDIVSEMTDARNNDTFRKNVAYDLMEREHVYTAVGECREVFRSIANQRTDNQKEPRP